jgi:hypothetical protein
LTLDTILAELKRERDRLDSGHQSPGSHRPKTWQAQADRGRGAPQAAHECRGTSKNRGCQAEVVGREEKERLKLGSVSGRPGGQAVLIGRRWVFLGGAAGSGHRLQWLAKLVKKLVAASEPAESWYAPSTVICGSLGAKWTGTAADLFLRF